MKTKLTLLIVAATLPLAAAIYGPSRYVTCVESTSTCGYDYYGNQIGGCQKRTGSKVECDNTNFKKCSVFSCAYGPWVNGTCSGTNCNY